MGRGRRQQLVLRKNMVPLFKKSITWYFFCLFSHIFIHLGFYSFGFLFMILSIILMNIIIMIFIYLFIYFLARDISACLVDHLSFLSYFDAKYECKVKGISGSGAGALKKKGVGKR